LSEILLTVCLLLASGTEDGIQQDQGRFYELEVATNPNYDSYYQAGVYQLIRGNLARGIRLLERIQKHRPEAHFYLGVAYYRLGEYEKAAHNFQEFCRVRSDVWQSCYYLSLIYLKQNNLVEAMHYLQMIPGGESRMMLEDQISEYGLLANARDKFSDSRYEEALEIYGQIHDFFGYRELGSALTYARLGRYEESLALLDTVINHEPDRMLVLMSLFESGRQFVQLRNMDKAKKYLREYMKFVADDNAKFMIGRIFSDEMKFDSARVYLKNLPDTVDAFLFYKGRTEYFLGLWSKAENNLLLHRERFPGSPFSDRTLYILASISFKRARYSEAIGYWRALIDSFPESAYAASALAGVGDAYSYLGDYGSALDAYKKVTQFRPSEDIASEVTLKTYETKYHQHKYPSLVDALRRYVRENPKSKLVARTDLRIAKIIFEMGRYYQSMNELDRIIENNPGTQVAVEALILRVQVSRAIENKYELLNSLRSLLLSDNAAEYRYYAISELGAFWTVEEKYDSALYYYNILLDSDTYRENAILKIANIYDKLGQTKEEIAMAERLVSEYPTSVYLADAYILHSRALRRQGDYEGAARMLQQVLEKIDDRADLYMELGNLNFETEEFSSARQCFLKACEIYEQDREDAAQALLLAGDASVRIGDKAGGKKYYLQANMIAESALLKNQAMQKLTALGED
jgi:tetratricopeptide (TPR) repeat protein